MKKYVLFMISIGLILGILLVYNIISFQKKNSNVFEESGYILQSASGQTQNVEKYYFNANETYKTKYDQKIVFDDTNGDQVTMAKANFVHYNNGGISSLQKGVIIDLQKVDANPIQYYSIGANKILKKQSDRYVISHLGGNLEFQSLIWKIADNKYLVAGNEITVNFNDGTSKVINGYIEIEYLDNQVVKLYNQELTYQTISTQVNIDVPNGIRLNLESKIVSKDGVNKMSLSNMVIDSNDNVEIVDLEEEQEKDEQNQTENETTDENTDDGDGTTQGNGNGQGNGSIQNGGIGQNGGAGEGTTGDGSTGSNTGSGSGNLGENDQIMQEDPTVNAPVFKVENFEVDSITMEATIAIVDDESKLVSDHIFKIIQNNTGKVVYYTEEVLGTYSIDLSVSTLSPDTEYTLVAESTYAIDDVEYTKNFIYKIFRTKSVGIDFEKDVFTNNTMKFDITVESDSKVKSAELALVNAQGDILQTAEVGNGTELGKTAEFVGLESNTEYIVRLTNVLYDGQVITNGFELEKVYKTLKDKPQISGADFEIDKRNSVFILKLTNVQDPDDGIKSFRYEVYDTRMNIQESDPVFVKETTQTEDVIVNVNGDPLERGVPYTFKVVAVFDDNEKEIEYESEFSQEIMKMDGVEFPTVRFEEHLVTFERIEGNLIVEDSNNTISLDEDNDFIISYSDSTGYTRSFTYQGSLTIPIKVNDLRANETYKFSVYTRVNLQDGNEPIDECYIGGAVIKTGLPGNMMAAFVKDDSDVKNTFNIKFNLRSVIDDSEEEQDPATAAELKDLEAKVLTGMQFSIYAGQTTDGNPVRTVKLVDENTKPYESQLKVDFFDNTASITPEFFGAQNKDFKDQYYTIKVSNAYDYTYDGGNALPILENTFTFNANGYMPDLPTDVDNAIDVITIRNRDVTPRPREDLNAETVVGYQIKATYDNSQNYAKKIVYSAYDATTGELVAVQEAAIGEDGTVPSVTFQVKDGTPYTVKDTEGLTRGNSYYFTYVAYLDLNGDGEPETIYPYQDGEEEIILKSKTVTPEKQAPRIIMYPSTSSNTTASYKYKCNDVDHALEEEAMSAIINGTSLRDTKPINTNSGEEFDEVTFETLIPGNLTIRVTERLLKAQPATYNELINLYFEGITNLDAVQYRVGLEENRVIITLTGDEETTKRITAVKAEFVSESVGDLQEVKVVKDLLVPVNNMITISFNDIYELLDRETQVRLTAYYDNGVTGYDLAPVNENDTQYVAYQKPYQKGETIYYYTINKEGNLVETTSATGNMYTQSRVDDEEGAFTTLGIVNPIDASEAAVQLQYSQSGFTYQNDPLLQKQIATQDLECETDNTIHFDLIIPGISMLNKATNELDITAALDNVRFNATLINKEIVEIENNQIVIELYQTDENGGNEIHVRDYTKSISDFTQTIQLDDLQPKTYYYIKFRANIIDKDGTPQTKYLYDIDYETVGKQYYFSTLANVGITDVKVEYVPVKYNNKTIDITYKLDKILGYHRIDYTIYKKNKESGEYELFIDSDHGVQGGDAGQNTGTEGDKISSDTLFLKEMKKSIGANPGSVFEFGADYKIKITPIAILQREGEEEQELDLGSVEHEFTLKTLTTPLVGISGYRTNNTDLTYKITIYDTDRIIDQDKYTIKVYNAQFKDITPEEYKVEFDTDLVNNTIELKGLDASQAYTLAVVMNLDYENDAQDLLLDETKRYTIDPINESGISVGNISSSNNAEIHNKIDLIFHNSYKLTEIEEVRYSIYNNSGYAQSDTEKFVPSAIHSNVDNTTYYTFTLNKNLPSEGRYIVELQFLKDGQIVDTYSLEHIYIEN